jgi:hypothetical protein
MGRPHYTAGASGPPIQAFRAKAHGFKGAILAATGVSDHAAFCTNLQTILAEAHVGKNAAAAAAPVYIGGEARVHAPSVSVTHVALAFLAPATSVVSNILKECLALKGATAFGGDDLVGVYGFDVDAMSVALTSRPSAETIRRAKNIAKSKALFALEDISQALAGAMTAQVLETGSFTLSGASYDSVADKDVNKTAPKEKNRGTIDAPLSPILALFSTNSQRKNSYDRPPPCPGRVILAESPHEQRRKRVLGRSRNRSQIRSTPHVG